MDKKETATLKLDGINTVFSGISVGANKNITGEVVFQTGMLGYLESIFDPSYKSQILIFTYPLIGNYGVPPEVKDEYGLETYFESNKIQVAGVICAEFESSPSHWNSVKSIRDLLIEQNIPAICNVDTRELTKLLREHGTTMGTISQENQTKVDSVREFTNYTLTNFYNRYPLKFNENDYLLNPSGNPKVVMVDCGVKHSQIRALLKRGACVKIVHHESDFLSNFSTDNSKTLVFDRLFISSGAGDPQDYKTLINTLKTGLETVLKNIPIFGICLGHQILALSSNHRTYKMKFGNRGQNIPCYLLDSETCYITSQNHGYAVDTNILQEFWKPLFTNANDKSNEGMYHTTLPYFSVQFHPEAHSGSRDTEFLFDVFLNDSIHKFVENVQTNQNLIKSKPRKIYNKVLILGSGALSIAQAGEFDYSGSQAIKSYKEEGLMTVLINPNIASVQSSSNFVDKVYYLPLTPEFIEQVILCEFPDCISLSFGGQTALNCGISLYRSGILAKYSIDILGTPIQAIIDTEDRALFKQRLDAIHEPYIPSEVAYNVDEATQAINKLGGYPVLIRSAYTLGGLGSGFINSEQELRELLQRAFAKSSQVIIDKSFKGWKELEYEIVRDAYDNTICVCNMENIDPLGIHTGDSIVVAPSQTLTDSEHQTLRAVAIKVIKDLGIIGECNIQFALDPRSETYYIIEVNARLSRSSALASKATGYPLAYIASKLGLGHSLLSLRNSLTQNTTACFEPSLDYCVVKMPYWDLRKFPLANKQIGSAMKSVGEAMAISRNFEEALQKAIRMTGIADGFEPNNNFIDESVKYDDSRVRGLDPITLNYMKTVSTLSFKFNEISELEKEIIRSKLSTDLKTPTYNRLITIATALSTEALSVAEISSLTGIDSWFLEKMNYIIIFRHYLEENNMSLAVAPKAVLQSAKSLGFSDSQIARYTRTTEIAIREMRKCYGVLPKVKQIDTVAGEFPCNTNYTYLTYNAEFSDSLQSKNGSDHNGLVDSKKLLVLGSGVYKIGSSVEFDWCTVNSTRRARELGYKVLTLNCNPETVSTDYDEADTLYFDVINFETVMDLYELEQPKGILLSMGGQVPNNIALALHKRGVPIIGTSPEMIDNAENRYKFSRTLENVGVDQPKWSDINSLTDALVFCKEVGYPCLVRPSYVLSGQLMSVVNSDAELKAVLNKIKDSQTSGSTVISKYILDAKEIEVDAVAQKGTVKALAVSEHIENAGTHSGDATLILPPQDLTNYTISRITDIAHKIASVLAIDGPFNIQFIAKDDQVKVIECNLRASRSFPFVSKTLGVNFAKLATDVMLGLQVEPQSLNSKNLVGVKVAKFSFDRLDGADPILGVEMLSTGEVACFGNTKYSAYFKAMISANPNFQSLLNNTRGSNILLSIGSYKHKLEFLQSVKSFLNMGYTVICSKGTADFYLEHNLAVKTLSIPQISSELIASIYKTYNFKLVINTSSESNSRLSLEDSKHSYGYNIRRTAIDLCIPLITNIKSAKLFVASLSWEFSLENLLDITPRIDSQTTATIVRLHGLVDIHVHTRDPGHPEKEDFESCTKSALAGGITTILAMPNTNPAITSTETMDLVKGIAKEKAYCNYGFYLGATAQNAEIVSDTAGLTGAVGLKMYLNQTYGELMLPELSSWTSHIKNWNSLQPICVHAEMQTLASIILLAKLYNKKLHICHVSKKEEIELIVACKKHGHNSLTCEVSPHHLFLTTDSEKNCLKTVKPSLGTISDQQALWDNLEYIDCFATDHAPHLKAQKYSDDKQVECSKCFGFAGLETALPLLLTAVREGKLSLDDITLRFYTNPCRIFNIHPQSIETTYIEVDTSAEWTIPSRLKYTKCDWTPFQGRKVYGIVRRVVLNGKTVFIDNKILSREGRPIELSPRLTRGSALAEEFVKETEQIVSKPVITSELSPKVLELSLRSADPVPKVPLSTMPEFNLQNSLAQLNLRGKSVVSADQFTKPMLKALFALAGDFKRRVRAKDPMLLNCLKGRLLSCVFYEPSTRTNCSFQSAMQRLGGGVIPINSDHSSVQKGESIEDFTRAMECYSDLIVLRSPVADHIHRAVAVSKVPIINAGNADIEHPTQALLDLFTIREESGTIKNKNITFYGDLKHSRTVHSLIKLLASYSTSDFTTKSSIKLNYITPESLKMPEELVKWLNERGIQQTQANLSQFRDLIPSTDVLYITRIQKERIANWGGTSSKTTESYTLTPEALTTAKESLVIMHPLPRVDEIDIRLDSDPRVSYFRQMENGLYIRMALLSAILE